MTNLYKIRDFAKILDVTTTTLRNKHRSGELIPSFVDPNNGHRFYTDELAYRYDTSKYILAYIESNDDNYIQMFHEKLSSLNIKYKIFLKTEESNNIIDNKSLKELIKELDLNTTYTIIYDKSNISETDLNIIKFYLESCRSNIKLKEFEDFSLEKNI